MAGAGRGAPPQHNTAAGAHSEHADFLSLGSAMGKGQMLSATTLLLPPRSYPGRREAASPAQEEEGRRGGKEGEPQPQADKLLAASGPGATGEPAPRSGHRRVPQHPPGLPQAPPLGTWHLGEMSRARTGRAGRPPPAWATLEPCPGPGRPVSPQPHAAQPALQPPAQPHASQPPLASHPGPTTCPLPPGSPPPHPCRAPCGSPAPPSPVRPSLAPQPHLAPSLLFPIHPWYTPQTPRP